MSVRIVCLDGQTTNPGDLSWRTFEQLGELVVHDRTPDDQIIERARDADCLLTNKTPLTAAAITALGKLRYIGVLATGYNVVDAHAAKARGVVVANVPNYSTDAVAQHTIALLLECASAVGAHDRAAHDGRWVNCIDFCFTVQPTMELAGKTFGVVGMGLIGKATARIAATLGMRLIAAHTRALSADELDGLAVEFVDLDLLFKRADVVSLHCPLNEKTHQLINRDRLAGMKPTAILINTGRGQLIDEAALAQALTDGRLAAAALDVLSIEPPPPNHPLLQAPRCILTPHMAWQAKEARQRLLSIAAANLKAYLSGRPVNQVL